MNIAVRNAAGESVSLSASALAQGGEAAVHTVCQYPNVVVKLYHPHVLQQRAVVLREKIEAITQEPKLEKFKQHQGLSWPRFSVFDERGQWRGYAMRKAEGVRMNVLAHAMAYREHFPQLDRPTLVAYLLNLLQTLRQLHTAGVCVGDYNLANFLCKPGTEAVTLIDCDSWQVQAAGKTFRCAVAAPDMLAPELMGMRLDSVPRTPASEHFSLAILIFKTLMLGRHPYDVVDGAGPVENIRNGHFPYGIGGGGIPKGAWFNIWSHLPYKLKELFVQTFRDGCKNPSERATVVQWIEALELYQREMSRQWHVTDIKPSHPKEKSYRGSHCVSAA